MTSFVSSFIIVNPVWTRSIALRKMNINFFQLKLLHETKHCGRNNNLWSKFLAAKCDLMPWVLCLSVRCKLTNFAADV